jgi:DNA-binding PadR family transcriptional regulator
MVSQVRENQHKILRFLYHNRGNYKTTSDISDGTGLSKGQVFYALDEWMERYVKVGDEDTRGDIEDANTYVINSDGRAYVRNGIHKIPQEQRNSEELEKHKKEIMLVRASVNEIEDDLDDWTEYSSRWNDKAMRRFEAIEERLEILEDELLED